MERSAVALCAVVVLAGSTANAQTLQYRLNGGTPQPVEGNTVDVGTVNGEVNLHIFDPGTYQSSSDPTLSAESTITITGTYTSGRLVVGFTDGDQSPDADQAPATPVSRGVLNLGTTDQPVLVFKTAGGADNPALRDATTLIAWIGDATSGSVLGDITVGRIYVIDAPADIRGSLTVTANDPDGPTVDLALNRPFAIQRLRVGNLISKSISAQGNNPNGETSTCSIGRIVVASLDPALRATGIRGDILAPFGRIESITSTGPMGKPAAGDDPAQPIAITARNGVRLIGAINAFGGGFNPESFPINKGDVGGVLDADSSVLAADLHLAVTAGPTGPFPIGATGYNRTVKRIVTRGNLFGSVNARWVGAQAAGQGVNDGILVGGTLGAAINITESLFYGNIIAERITSPVIIGRGTKGSIIAHAADGAIPLVSIGALPDAPGTFGEIESLEDGMRGGGSISADDPYNPFSAAPINIESPTEPDGVISANRIDSLYIDAMYRSNKQLVPRVEARSIGTLEIGTMHQGVVWSGVNSNGTVTQTDNYVTVDNAILIQRMAAPNGFYASEQGIDTRCLAAAAIWVRDFPEIRVRSDSYGMIHVPRLSADQVIRIDGRQSFIKREIVDLPGSSVENPRNPRYSRFNVGGVGIEAASGLVGQIVVNAAAGGASIAPPDCQFNPELVPDYLLSPGPIVIGDERRLLSSADAEITLAVDGPLLAAAPNGYEELDNSWHRSPAYWIGSSSLGGGAVGLVPYRIHREDSMPAMGLPVGVDPNQTTVRTPGAISALALSEPGTAYVQFYGPVFKPEAVTGPLLKVELVDGTTTVDATSNFTFSVGTGSLAEQRRVYLLTSCRLPSGLYRVSRLEPSAGGPPLRCALTSLDAANAPAIAGPNEDNIPTDLDAHNVLEFRVFTPPCNPADIGQSDGSAGADGCVNNGDFSLFFQSFFNAVCPDCGIVTTTPCNPADIAQTDGTPGADGCVDNGDFQLFFASFFSAECPDCVDPCPLGGATNEGGGEGEGMRMMSSMARSATAAGLDPAVIEQRLNALRNLGRPITPEDVRAAFPELLPGGSGGGPGGGSDQ